MLKNKKKFD